MTSLLTTVGATLSQEIQALRGGGRRINRRSLSSPPERGRAGAGVGADIYHEQQQQYRDEQQQQHGMAVAQPLKVGDRAPQSGVIHFPRKKPVIIVFLRHCGCPFAEKTFRLLTEFSTHNKQKIHCIAVTQASSQEATDQWVIANGGEWDVEVLSNPSRDLYAQWGLGMASSWWRVFGPVQIAEAYKLGVNEGIWGTGGAGGSSASSLGTGMGTGRPLAASSASASASASVPRSFLGPPTGNDQDQEGEASGSGGNRWQMGGVFAVDEDGIVRWAHVETSASDIPDLKLAKKALEEAAVKRKREREEARSGWDSWNEVEQRFVP